MKYDNKITEAAHCLVTAGLADQTVGVLTEGGEEYALGPQWQGLVRVARHRLLRCTQTDTVLAWSDRMIKHVKPGHEFLVWVVEENGTMLTHAFVDMDGKDHVAKMEALRASFAEVTRHYQEDSRADSATV